MTTLDEQTRMNPRHLCKAYFSYAKRLWAMALFCKAGVIALGIIGVWVVSFSKLAPIFVFAVSAISEVLTWRSDKAKSVAESLLRKLDFKNSLGWNISKAEMSDILFRTPVKIRTMANLKVEEDDYFECKDQIGTHRALKNLQESAWWSKHLSEKMGQYLLGLSIISFILSLLFLLITIYAVSTVEPPLAVKALEPLSNVARVVTAALMLFFSLGLFRLTLGYYTFSQKAHRAEERATELLKGSLTETDVFKLYADYHLDRSAAPLIPDKVYKIHQPYLNQLWGDRVTN